MRFARLTHWRVRVLGSAVRVALRRQSQPDLNTTYGGADAVLGGSGRDEREYRLVDEESPCRSEAISSRRGDVRAPALCDGAFGRP